MPRPDSSDSPPVLQMMGVRRSFTEGERRREVLKGVDLALAAGEFMALLGPSGSGKSTLLNLASGIDRPDHGDVLVSGVELHRLSERKRTLFRRDRIGFVFQFFNLVPTLTVEENLLLPLSLRGGADQAARRRAQDLLDAVGLPDRGGAWPDRLSGGEQQRVALARALIHEPELVLADEPTGNLDEETGGRTLDLLERLLRDAGTALLCVTHSRDVALRMDRIMTLREGRVVAREMGRTPPRTATPFSSADV